MAEKESLIQQDGNDGADTPVSVTVAVGSSSSGVGVGGLGNSVNCQICSAAISLEGKLAQHVVKCPECCEATPIKAAPAGKKYVRCPCNCLLICKAAGRRIACPRPNCKRVIALGHSAGYGATADSGSATSASAAGQAANQIRCLCGHCGGVFAAPAAAQFARCQHCARVSSVGPHFARRRFLAFAVAAVACFVATCLLMGLTWAQAVTSSGGLFAVYVGCVLITGALTARSCVYSRTKISVVESVGATA